MTGPRSGGGLNVNSLITDDDLKVWVIYDPLNKVSVRLKYLKQDELLQLRDRCVGRDGKTDQRKLRRLICEECILDWKGFRSGSGDKEKELVCNKENITRLVDKLTGFSYWVETQATEYSILMNFRLLEEKKRSGNGSEPGSSSRKSTAKRAGSSKKKKR